MPKYVLLIIEDERPYVGFDETSAQYAEIMQMHHDFTAEVTKAGATVLGGEALLPVATATFLRGTRSDQVTVVDNPAPDLKEALGGYYVVEAADDAQARELAARCPAPHGYIELRPVWDIPG